MLDNQQDLFEKLIEELDSYDQNVIILKGNAGVGKTYVIEQLIKKFKARKNFTICCINGDQFCKEREYYCIKQALSEMSVKYAQKQNDKELISEFSGELPIVGDISKKIISDKLNYKNVSQNNKTFFLNNDDEKNIVYRLNYLFEKKKALIICDSFQYFDLKSLQMVYLFLKNCAQFEFMKQCSFLIVVTPENDYDSNIDNIIEKFKTKEFTLSPISYEELDIYLDSLNLKIALDDSIKKIFFNLANGHLEVIKQIAKEIDSQYLDYNANVQALEKYLEILVNKNLETLGTKGNEISNLLEYASLIGKKFLNDEVKKTYNLSRQDYLKLMQYSENMEYIIQDKPYTYFSNEIIQIVFRNKAHQNNILYYEKMSDCVKELFPSDYKRRIDIELKLENGHNAAILSVLLFFKHKFQTFYQEEAYLENIKEDANVNEFFTLFKPAVEQYNQRNYKEALNKLSYIYDLYPCELLVIRDIVKSASLTKILDNDSRREALECLEHYTLEKINREGDLYLQVLLTLISSYSHNGMIEEAKECEKRIMNYLQPRISYDENARLMLYTLKRISNCVHECVFSEIYIRQSVEFFKPLPGNTMALNPLQYVMSLANHTGILIECSSYKEALCEIQKAYDFININPTICFPKLHIIDNNFLVALYLHEPKKKKEILKIYARLMNLSENADNIFITSNYCAFLAINGEIDLAYERLLQTRQQARNTSEAFYEICIENNILILEIFKKDYAQAQKILNELRVATNGIIDESYYKKKYDLLQTAIEQHIEIQIEDIDTFIFKYCQSYQEAWAYWGHSFDFTALYYWSDL